MYDDLNVFYQIMSRPQNNKAMKRFVTIRARDHLDVRSAVVEIRIMVCLDIITSSVIIRRPQPYTRSAASVAAESIEELPAKKTCPTAAAKHESCTTENPLGYHTSCMIVQRLTGWPRSTTHGMACKSRPNSGVFSAFFLAIRGPGGASSADFRSKHLTQLFMIHDLIDMQYMQGGTAECGVHRRRWRVRSKEDYRPEQRLAPKQPPKPNHPGHIGAV